MITGSRVVNLTIDEGGAPPHIKPLLASIVSAIECGNWGEVNHSRCTAQELEESQDDLAEALEESEASLQEVKEAGWYLVEEVNKFCNSAEVVAVSAVLKKAYYELAVSMVMKKADAAGRGQEVEDADTYDTKELLEEIKQAEEDFDRVVKELKAYAKGKLEDFQD